MKTIYSIGRDPGCDICLYDDKNLISRNHALLKVGKGGKYFILDQSMNGTYINGIRVASGVQVPVTRKDVISFAHVAELDWDQIPKPILPAVKFALIGLAAFVVIGGLGYCGYQYLEKRDAKSVIVNPDMPVITESEDSTANNTQPNDTTVTDTSVVSDPAPVKETESKPKLTKKKPAETKTETETETEAEPVKDTVKYQPFV